MQEFLAQLQQMLANPQPARSTGTWPARSPSPSCNEDPLVASPQKRRDRGGAAPGRSVAGAGESSLPSGIRTIEAWRRADWLVNTLAGLGASSATRSRPG